MNKNKGSIEERLRKRREDFLALPNKERIRANRESCVSVLVFFGYLTPREARRYKRPIKELPKSRKELVMAYALSGIENQREVSHSIKETDELNEILSNFSKSVRDSAKNGDDFLLDLKESERVSTAKRLGKVRMDAFFKRVETFVDVKRRRIRKQLLYIMTNYICFFLLPEKLTLEPIPYLKEFLRNRGYRWQAKSLSEKDEEAIKAAATHYLDLLEYCFLSGLGWVRNEEYIKLVDEEGNFKKDFVYRDVYDEALLEFAVMYQLLDSSIVQFYDSDTSEATNFLMKAFDFLKGDLEDLNNTKFSRLLKEESRC